MHVLVAHNDIQILALIFKAMQREVNKMEAKQNNKLSTKKSSYEYTLSSEFPIMGFLVKVFFIKEKKSSYTVYTSFYTEVNSKHRVPGIRRHGKQHACTEAHSRGETTSCAFQTSPSPGVRVTGVRWGGGRGRGGRVWAGAAGAETWRHRVRIHAAGLLYWKTQSGPVSLVKGTGFAGATQQGSTIEIGKCLATCLWILDKVYF